MGDDEIDISLFLISEIVITLLCSAVTAFAGFTGNYIDSRIGSRIKEILLIDKRLDRKRTRNYEISICQ